MATLIVCDFKENDKAPACATAATYRVIAQIREDGNATTYNVHRIDACNQHVVPLTAVTLEATRKPEFLGNVVAELGNAPSNLGVKAPKVDVAKAKFVGLEIQPF